jgi:hypothetical protein
LKGFAIFEEYIKRKKDMVSIAMVDRAGRLHGPAAGVAFVMLSMLESKVCTIVKPPLADTSIEHAEFKSQIGHFEATSI